jgi:hypothetical protein
MTWHRRFIREKSGMPWAGQLKCCKMLKMIFWAIFLKTGHRIVLFFGMSIEADGLYDLAKTIYA